MDAINWHSLIDPPPNFWKFVVHRKIQDCLNTNNWMSTNHAFPSATWKHDICMYIINYYWIIIAKHARQTILMIQALGNPITVLGLHALCKLFSEANRVTLQNRLI
jgi:hypothetical protein